MTISIPKSLALLAVLGFVQIGTATPSTAQEGNDNFILSAAEEIELSPKEMGASRGASGFSLNTQESTQTLGAISSDNTLQVGGDLKNGDIALGSGFAGIGSYVMNTGNNSTINSAVSLNIQIMSAPPSVN